MKTLKNIIKSFVILLIIPVAVQLAKAQTSYWTGADATGIWSDSGNWAGGEPGSGSSVIFSNDTTAQATSPFSAVGDGAAGNWTMADFNSQVDSTFVSSEGGSISSLAYTNLNNYQNTLLAHGATLTTSGLTIGSLSVDFGANTLENVTIAGSNSVLDVNNSSATVSLGLESATSGSHMATLDMSGLGTFDADVSAFSVGAVNNDTARPAGIVYLAMTNTITAGSATAINDTEDESPVLVAFNVGVDGDNASQGSRLYLGWTNAINAGNIQIGIGKQSSSEIQFNPNLTNAADPALGPSIYIRNNNGASPVTEWNVGDGLEFTGTSSAPTGTADFSGGTVNALVTTMYLGRSANASGAVVGTGILNLGAGIFNVGTLYVGYQAYSDSDGGVGTVNINGPATLSAGSLVLAHSSGTAAGEELTFGTLNVTGGTVDVGTVTEGTSGDTTSTINLTNATLVVTNTLCTAAAPLTSLSVASASILRFSSVINTTTNAFVKTITSDNTGTIIVDSLPGGISYPSTPFPLIAYTTGSTILFPTVTLPGVYTGYITNFDNGIWLVVTNGPVNLKWGGGVNNLWDTTTLNWMNNGVAVTYKDGNSVIFDDTATTPNVDVTAAFHPATWTNNNNSLNYTFSGFGSVSGVAALVMNGSASVTLAETGGDNFSGGIAANAGTVVMDDANSAIAGGLTIASGATVQIGNNDANGSLPSGAWIDNGTLVYDQTGYALLPAAISGSGGLTQEGSGTLALSVSNGYTGSTTISGGTLALTNSGSIANSISVSVSGATLDVSGVSGAGVTTLSTLNLANSTLNIEAGYVQSDLNVSSLSMTGANTINVRSLPPIASYPTTVTLLYASGSISGFNTLSLGTLPSASPAYTTSGITESGSTVQITLTGGPVGIRPDVTWSGADALGNVSTNWSDAMNWQTPGVPTPQDNVVFNDTAAQSASDLSTPGGGASALIPANINNIVNANFTVSSLTFTNVNGTYHNTFIDNGDSLTITNTLTVGSSSADFGDSASDEVNVAGPNGMLNVNNTNSTFFVGLVSAGDGSEQATLDMSALGTFNAAVSLFSVGAINEDTSYLSGSTYLAQTNIITASGGTVDESSSDETLSLMVGQTGKGASPECYLYLGQQNVINANTIGVALAKESAEMQFNPIWTNQNPTVTIRAADGVSPVSAWTIGDGLGQTGSSSAPIGTADFSGGTVNALVTTMYLGKSPNVSGNHVSTGTLTFGAGTISVGTLYDGYQAYSDTDGGVGTVNINGPATLSVGSLVMAKSTGTEAGEQLTFGTLNVAGGIVDVGTVTEGTSGYATSTINLTNATLALTNTLCTSAAPLTALSVNNGSTLQFSTVADDTTNAFVQTITSDNSGAINITSSLAVAVKSYPSQPIALIAYTTSGSGVTFSTVTLPAGYTGYITNFNNVIWLVVTSGPTLTDLKWGGGINNLWDTTTLNWTNNGVAVSYQDLDEVTFDDVSQTQNVNVTATFMPLTWTNNNSLSNYTFSGIGKISGPVGLVMNGGASVTLSESGGDNFSGGISANAGTVVLDDANSAIAGGLNIASGATAQVGNNDTNGAIPSGILTDNGTLAFDQTGYTLLSLAIAGSGGLTQDGSGTLALSDANTYNGNTAVSGGGTLALTNSGSIANSSSVNVNGATLDVSSVSGSTTLNALNLANSALNVEAGYIQTNLNVSSLSMSGANTINVHSLPPIESYPATIVLLYASEDITGFNTLSLGTLPSASPAYAGTIAEGAGNKTVVLTLISGPIQVRPSVTWSGADALGNVSTNWSDGMNWQSPEMPSPSDNVFFNDTAAWSASDLSTPGGGVSALIPANANNIVNANFTISSLTYTNINSDYQNTLIANGATLTISNTFSVGTTSSNADFTASANTFVTIAGPNATMNVGNTNSLFNVGFEGAHKGEMATLDMSALGTFNASVESFQVGAVTVDGIYPASAVTNYLAETNTITAVGSLASANAVVSSVSVELLSLIVGENGMSDYGLQSSNTCLLLGRANMLNVNSIGIGIAKATASMQFNPIWMNQEPPATVTIRAADGVSPVTVWSIGDGLAQTGATAYPIGVADFSGGIVNASVATMFIGRSPDANGGSPEGVPGQGTLTFGAGTIAVNNLYVGYEPFPNTDWGFGTVNVNGTGLLQVGTLYMGLTTNTDIGNLGAFYTTGTLDVTNGIAAINTIVTSAFGSISTVNVSGGTLLITNTAGTTAAPLSALNFTGGTLELDVNGNANVTNVVAISISTSGKTTLQIGSLNGVAPGVAYPLISYTGTDPYANLTLALPSGYAGNLVDNSGLVELQLTTLPPSAPPCITSIRISGNALTINATNGVDSGTYTLLESTNLTLPVSRWKPVLTNVFNADGTINLSTNIVVPGTPEEFYLLEEQP